jgi:cell division protein FtsW
MGQRVAVAPKRTQRYADTKNAGQALRLRIDVPLLGAIVTLLAFGILMVFSASWDVSLYLYDSHFGVFTRQLLWLGVGSIMMAALIFIDYRWIARLVVPAMGVTIAMLVAVLVINEVRLGSARTVNEGSVQPSELAKLVTVLYLAVWLFAKKERLHDVWLGLVPLGLILGLLGGLILRQPDLSAALTIFILGGMLFFLAGGDIKQIIILVVIAVLVGWIIVWFNPTGNERMETYLPGLRDPLDASYHVRRSLGAFVNGGWLGTGISNGTVKLNNLPLPHSDSIFAVVGEELGVWGATLMVILFGIILWRGLAIARNAPDGLGRLLAAGLSFWLVMEAFLNMGGILGLLPFAGNALPFVSAGGSSLVVSMMAIGILLNISRFSEEKREREERRTFSEVVGLRRWYRRGRVSRSRRHRTARR